MNLVKIKSIKKISGNSKRYDVETRKTHNFLANGVVVHNSNFRAACVDSQLFAGSRTSWKAERIHVEYEKDGEKIVIDKDGTNPWWVGLRNHPEIIEFLKANENIVAYGEIYGRVQCLHYGYDNDIHVVLFDLLRGHEWISWDESQELAKQYGLPWVPMVYRGPFNNELLRGLAEENSIMPKAPKGHIREGLVIKPVKEMQHPKLGRIQLKLIANRYLDKT